MTSAAPVATSAHVEAVPATADQNNHVHGATGGINTVTANQKKKNQKRMIMKKNRETFMNDRLHGITMIDDIVTRLRNVPEKIIRMSGSEMNPYYNRCQEAADKIELLRNINETMSQRNCVLEADRDRWTQCAERLVEWENKDAYISAMEFYRENQRLDTKAVNRGE